MSGFGILIDTTLCVGCYACEAADAERWGNPVTEDHKLSAVQNTAVIQVGESYVPRMCMHCAEPTCVSVCPVGAFEKVKTGAVVYDADKCMGCRYCMQACPFDVPKYEWESVNPKITKCNLCQDRISHGEKPACVEACSTGARTFGTVEELIKEAQKRMYENSGKYYPSIYGVREAGGTSILYISDKPFEQLGLKTNLPHQAMPNLTQEILSKIPNYIFWGGTLLSGVWWITNRRKEVQAFELKLQEMESQKENESLDNHNE
jgi:formate dehydrogenase iron-sulfur subunit